MFRPISEDTDKLLIYNRGEVIKDFSGLKVGDTPILMRLNKTKKDDRYTLTEWRIEDIESRIVCDENFYQPNACVSIDCSRDNLGDLLERPLADVHSAVTIKPNYKYIASYTIKDSRGITIDIKSIICNIEKIDGYNHMAYLKVIDIIKRSEKNANKAYEHVLNHIYNKNITYNIDVYCPHFSINRNRVYGIGLFLRNNRGNLVYYNELNKPVYIHKDSDENYDSEGKLVTGNIIRYYYDKKYSNEKYIIADGRSMNLIERSDLRFIDSELSANGINSYHTKNDFSFIGYENENGIHALIRSHKNFNAIRLSRYSSERFIISKEILIPHVTVPHLKIVNS